MRWPGLVSVIVAATLLAPGSSASADVVVAGGAEVAIGEGPSPTAYIATGGFARLAVTTEIPEYTSHSRGYIWNSGFGADVTVRRGDLDGDEYESGLVGLRYDITFSQRRMGLLGVSGKGGFYVVARSGLIRSDALAGAGGPRIAIVPSDSAADGGFGSDSPVELGEPRTRGLAAGAAGTYVLLGDHIRLITELGGFVMGSSFFGGGAETTAGLGVRVGLGVDL